MLYTVDNLVAEVRDLLDEANTDTISTELSILPSLNRAQNYAFDIYSRKYKEPILTHASLTLAGGTAEYNIPEGCFEDRIEKVEIQVGQTYQPVLRISYIDVSIYESNATVAIPQYYCVVGRKLRFVGTPSGTYSARIWYLRKPEKLVVPQGRITRVNSASSYVIVDTQGSSLTTESDQLGSYINVVNGETGEIRSSHQIQALPGSGKVTIRTTPLRATVLGRTISGTLPDDVSADDYVCAIDGICVPFYSQPLSNFLVLYSVAELSGPKLGADNTSAEKLVEKFEKQVEKTWSGRERQMRVQKRSSKWGDGAGGTRGRYPNSN